MTREELRNKAKAENILIDKQFLNEEIYSENEDYTLWLEDKLLKLKKWEN